VNPTSSAATATRCLHYGNGSEPQGLDPQVVTGVPENHLIRALFEGLAVKNPYTLEPEPGVAERWEFSEDRRGRSPSTSIPRRAGQTATR
jgi:ABC-type oligopeptide transport system substrate-binding subunit